MSRPLVIAHRGASGERPENTLSAYALAVEQGADMIEIDLHRSLDGVVMIHHDAELARLGGEGAIEDRTAAELAGLNAAPGAADHERIPTLVDVLEAFGDRIEFNLEMKVGRSGAPYEGLEETVLSELEARGLLPRMLLSSFSDLVLERLRSLSSRARLGVLVAPRAPRRILERARGVQAEAIHPHTALVRANLIRKAHAEGLRVYPYTEDDPGRLARLLDLGVDGIITNHPARLRRLIDERCPGSSD